MHTLDHGDDQAAGRRYLIRPSPVKVVAVTGGKGGVGKTNVATNLATALAGRGREVLLFDADLGLANVDVLLGLQPHYNLSHVLGGECALEDVILTASRHLSVVPAASGVSQMARLSHAEHAGLIQAFSQLGWRLDVLLVDTAPGISDSVIRFSQACQQVIVVVCDEPPSTTDAFALIKVLSREYGVRRFRILVNMTRTVGQGRELFLRIAEVTERRLDVNLDFMGTVPYDECLRKAVQRRRAVVDAYPQSRAAMAFKNLADEADKWPVPDGPRGHLEFFIERLVATGALDGASSP